MMKKEKQDSAFSQLMNYAGSYKMFTYTALVSFSSQCGSYTVSLCVFMENY